METASPLLFPNGTPLPTMNASTCELPTANTTVGTRCVSVVSYNLLAPAYVRPFDKRTGSIQPFAAFSWCSDADLEWATRRQKLLNLLLSCEAHVICLQELQLERNVATGQLELPIWIRPLLQNYTAKLPPQSELETIAERNVRVLEVDAAVTCAVLYQTRAFQTEDASSQSVENNTNTCVTVGLHSTSTIEAVGPIFVSSVHLDATDERKRVGQLAKCLKQARDLAGIGQPLTVIIAGDMNQEFLPGSCVEGFLCTAEELLSTTTESLVEECQSSLRLPDEPTESQLETWKELRLEANRVSREYCVSLKRVETGETRSAYDSSGAELSNDMRQWKLDHILYTSDTILPLSTWATLEDDGISCSAGLPNDRCPSDHLPVAAVLRVTPFLPLGNDQLRALLTRLHSLWDRQGDELKQLEKSFEAELKEVQAACGVFADLKKTAKKARPPEKVVEVMRRKRAAIKLVKAQHRKDRESLASMLSYQERLAMHRELGCSVDKWAERC